MVVGSLKSRRDPSNTQVSARKNAEALAQKTHLAAVENDFSSSSDVGGLY